MNVPDIYFELEYAKLYENENCKAVEYRFECEHGAITNLFLKRKIDILCPNGVQYYDRVTPYGYGGPIIRSLTGDKSKLLEQYEKAMRDYTKKNHIVSEFVRFHPIIGNGPDFGMVYSSKFDRKTVGTNVRDYELAEEFSKSAYKTIRRAEKAGVTYEILRNDIDIDEFRKIYFSTMDRDSADEFYYFDEKYFDHCREKLGEYLLYVRVLFEGKAIAAGCYFAYGDIIHCHLSGTMSEYLNLSPAYIIKLATATWGRNNGFRYIHYGGGTSPDANNSLYKFKKKFGQNTEFDFYIGKKIWDLEAYNELCKMVGVTEDIGFFPAYRSKR